MIDHKEIREAVLERGEIVKVHGFGTFYPKVHKRRRAIMNDIWYSVDEQVSVGFRAYKKSKIRGNLPPRNDSNKGEHRDGKQ